MNIVLANQIVSSIPQLQSTCFGSYVNTVFGIPKCNINLSPDDIERHSKIREHV